MAASTLPGPLRPWIRLRLWMLTQEPKMSSKALAEALGIVPGYVSNLLNGGRVPSAELRRQIRDLTGILESEWDERAAELRAVRSKEYWARKAAEGGEEGRP